MKSIFIIFLFVFFQAILQPALYSQCGQVNSISLTKEVPFSGPVSPYAARTNPNADSIMYVAASQRGFFIYDKNDAGNPTLLDSVMPADLGTSAIMNFRQYGNYLYLALGEHLSITDSFPAGLAILDVTNPVSPIIKDVWINPDTANGSAFVYVEGDYAYLCAMQDGLIILNVANKDSIYYMSEFHPDKNYPPDPNIQETTYNVRGVEVRNSIAYVCFDAGGLRIINCTDKLNPVETGHYANPSQWSPNDQPRAYNNIVLNDSIAYLGVDFCGFEILNIGDTSNITLTGWWNPYDCPTNNWFTSPVHVNEVEYIPSCNVVVLSTGKSECFVIDVSDPTSPDSCMSFGSINDTTGTWGVSVYNDEILLTYIYVPMWNFLAPFKSLWSGVKILHLDTDCLSSSENSVYENRISIFPNPSNRDIKISGFPSNEKTNLRLTDISGRILYESDFISENEYSFNIEKFHAGIYFLSVSGSDWSSTKKIVVE